MAQQGSGKKTTASRSSKSKGSGGRGGGSGGKPPDGDGPGPEDAGSSGERRTAYISGSTFRAKPVQYEVVDGWAMFEGDIVLGTVEQVERQSEVIKAELRGDVASGVAITGSNVRWPSCTVPYEIDPNLPNQARVTDAIQHWRDNTSFEFVLRTNANAGTYPDYVTFTTGGGCAAHVGRRGGQQFVWLGSGCSTGNTIHEIGHAVGLWHEQSREDRDAFVTINWANIQAGKEGNFQQHITDGDDIGAYDYGSIMHYGRTAFGIGGAETITPVDPSAVIGQRTALSPGDIATANSFCQVVPTRVETLKEIRKELVTETAKERITETTKELSPETIKELSPETIKERIPETVKEQAPETVKERVPETVKERFETLVEGPTVVTPGRGGYPDTGELPFAMATPYAGAPGTGGEGLEERVAALEAIVAELAQAYDAQLGGGPPGEGWQ